MVLLLSWVQLLCRHYNNFFKKPKKSKSFNLYIFLKSQKISLRKKSYLLACISGDEKSIYIFNCINY